MLSGFSPHCNAMSSVFGPSYKSNLTREIHSEEKKGSPLHRAIVTFFLGLTESAVSFMLRYFGTVAQFPPETPADVAT